MTAQIKRRALILAFVLLAVVFASRVFYFQELFFAFLLFAALFLFFLFAAGLAFGLWFLYARLVLYLAARAVKQGHQALPLFRILVLWLAPTVAKTAEAVSASQQILFYPFRGLLRGWLHSLRFDASHFRADAERAIKHLRLPLKQS